ncbi:rod shape-determining protein MreC [Maribacter orientalis]|uniref:Cell shape-determining protein MreC n=1 Tax=Maribacter orientalis TaxID=228957 RepID=A0A1H7JX06_9FLAO|nr:rod shape-determining protein MreC [Maribacter orientalis]SEK79118.1 rod shape-determining protein MreC [Maribacter orientalis]|tara:strand:- start:467 stop:1291 length:825 start_codon:yes stop_codon:yes gene_type:complete
MQQIINFLIRYKTFLLYLSLLLISFIFTFQSHSYHQSKFLNSSNYITGSIYSFSDNITSYFNLREENNRLVEENKKLRDKLFNNIQLFGISIDTSSVDYEVIRGRVINNSYADQRNYITINKGQNDSIAQDMGVITDKGILGIVENTSANYSTVQSILSEKSNINAKIKNSNHFGSLVWENTTDYNVVQLIDIPRLVPLTIGDTIVTGAMSSIFPENIPIGTIKRFDLDNSKSFYFIDVELFNDMTNIGNVYIIRNLNRKEVLELEAETEANDQ